MNVKTITIDPEIALGKLKEYRNVAIQNRRTEDADFRRLYRAASSGRTILDVSVALKETGVNEKGHPRLALAWATWPVVYYYPNWSMFSCRPSPWGRGSRLKDIALPTSLKWPSLGIGTTTLRTRVPFIPPVIRPKDSLEKYHILFEVPDWEEYSSDPFLLRHIAGWLFVVCGEWELTDLERSLLTR